MWKHPPGDEIYRKGNISVFEVDGKKNKVKDGGVSLSLFVTLSVHEDALHQWFKSYSPPKTIYELFFVCFSLQSLIRGRSHLAGDNRVAYGNKSHKSTRINHTKSRYLGNACLIFLNFSKKVQ